MPMLLLYISSCDTSNIITRMYHIYLYKLHSFKEKGRSERLGKNYI